MQQLGLFVTIVGVLLLVGNISGMFRTIPFLGGITIAIGAAMMRSH